VKKEGGFKLLIFSLIFVTLIGFSFLTSFDYSEPFNSFKLGSNALSLSGGNFLTGASVGETELGIQAGIGGCAQINVSGTYTLTGDYVTSSGYAGGTDCFIIGASNVVLDGAGYTVTDNATGRGVTLSDDTASNITIQNLGLTTFSNFMYLGSENNTDITVDGVTINSTQSGGGADGGIYSFGPNVTFKNSIFYHYAQAMGTCPILKGSDSGGGWGVNWNITNNTFVLSYDDSIDSAICLYNNTGSTVTNNVFNYTGGFTAGPGYPSNNPLINIFNCSSFNINSNTLINTGKAIHILENSNNANVSYNSITLQSGIENDTAIYNGAIFVGSSSSVDLFYNNVSGIADRAISIQDSATLNLTENRITDSGVLTAGFLASLSPITVDGTVCDDGVLFEAEVINADNTYVSGVYSSINYDVVCRRMDDGVANETVYFPTAGGINCENNAPPILKGGTCMGYVSEVFLNNSATTSFTYNTTAFANPTNGTSVNVSNGSTYPPYLNYNLTAVSEYGLWLVNSTGITILNNYFVDGSFNFDVLSSANLTFTNDSVAEIQWNSLSDVSMFANLSNNDNVYLSSNLAGVNTESGNYNDLNTSAQITLYGLNDTTHYLLKDGVRCDDSGICNISSDGTTLIANVSSFSNYTTQEAAVDASPNVTLVSPAASYSNTSASSYNLTFNCSATDDSQLLNISLYITNSTNQSFAYNQTTDIAGTSNSTSWTLNLSTGNYTWNCLAYDNASQSDWDTNRTLALSYLADNYPYWSTNTTSIVTTYSSSTLSLFNITWQDERNVSTVYLESNYSGIATNYTMDNITASIYNYSAILPAGTYYWKSYANDSTNQINVTGSWTFTIAQASSEVNTTINNSESNLTVDKDTTIDLNCTLITGEGNISLYNNGTLINSGTSPIGNSTTFSSKGLYNITCSYTSTTNYSASSETYYVTVPNTIPTLTQPTITPATAYTNNTLTANTTYTDLDNEAGTVYFLWYVDSVNVYNQTNTSISNGTVVITTLASTYFNKTNAVNLSVYANDGTNNSATSWSSNIITITNLAPSFDQDLTAQTINYSQAFTYDVNCSDTDSDTLTYYDNTSLFNINSSTGIITDTPVFADIGETTINISCDDGTINTSQTFVYNITDGTAPTVRITAPVTSINTTSTLLNSTTSENATCYYKNSTASYAVMNLTGNTTHSQNITSLALGNNLYSVQCNDSYANSATQTTYVLRVNVVANETNTTALTFVGNSTNSSSILTNLNLTINISASLSNVAISGSEFASNPEQETFAITGYTITEFKFYAIDAPEIADYINKITLSFNYNETEVLAAGITETSLGVFYYNSATDLWVAESEVYVDTTANTIEANVTHLSTFVLGQATATAVTAAAAAASSSSSGSGSGWGVCGDTLCNGGETCDNCPDDCEVCPVEDVVEETIEDVVEETVEEVVDSESADIVDSATEPAQIDNPEQASNFVGMAFLNNLGDKINNPIGISLGILVIAIMMGLLIYIFFRHRHR